MTHTNSDYQARQLKRWTRPDAYRFVRPDWRRFVHPGFERDHPFALYERKYSADQPRVPAGDPAAGSGRVRVAVLVAMIHASSPMQRQTP